MFHPQQDKNYSMEYYTESINPNMPAAVPIHMFKSDKIHKITHQVDQDENLAVGFRGSNVRERNHKNSFDIFQPKQMYNVRLNKKYFAKHHKNQR